MSAAKKTRLPKRSVKSRNALLSRPPSQVAPRPVPPSPGAPHAFGAPRSSRPAIDLQTDGRVSERGCDAVADRPPRTKTGLEHTTTPKCRRRAAPKLSVNDSGAATSDGFVSLFNGRDLTGWKTHATQPGKWRVENGVLIGSDPGRTGRVRAVRSGTHEPMPEYQGVPRGTFLYSERGDFADFHLRSRGAS